MTSKRFISIKVLDGLYLYKDPKNSPNYQIRIRHPILRKNLVKSSRTDNLYEAKEFAKGYYLNLSRTGDLTKTPLEQTFKYWCKKYLKHLENTKSLKPSSISVDYSRLLSKESGMCSVFGDVDVNKITNDHLSRFFERRDAQLGHDETQSLSDNTKNKYVSLLKTVLRFIVIENGLTRIPELITYKQNKQDNPRPSFNFDKKNDEYKMLLTGIRTSIDEKDVVRYQPITDDLYDVVMFLVHGFLRPTVSEVFSIRFKDIKVIDDGETKTLQIQINNGKTGFRITNSTDVLVERYQIIKERNPEYDPNDFIFMKDYKNRVTVSRIFQKQFQHILKKYNLENDEFGQTRSLYSCRHLAIQMRLVRSGGKINILWFAKNCGTSVEMIERFYAKYLPNDKEVIRNLQSFADK